MHFREMKVAKLATFLVLSMMAAPAGIYADVHVRRESHVDSYYYGGVIHPAEDSRSEVWVGDNRLAYVTDRRKIVFDMKNNILLYVNRDEKSFAEIPVPWTLSDLFPEDMAARVAAFKTQGTVKRTGETRKIGKRKCQGYEINSFVPFDGIRYYEMDRKLWVTADVPFDIKKFQVMNMYLQKLGNLTDEYSEELKKIEGLVILDETTRYETGTEYKATDRVLSIAAEDPPDDLYSVPAGFTRKEKLSIQDFR